MNIAAFDLSLTATGLATNFELLGRCARVVENRSPDNAAISSGVLRPERINGLTRLRYIREVVLEIANDADLVVLEGLAFGAKGNAMLDLAGLAAVVRLALADCDRPFVDVPPSTLKKFAVGNGNAPKDEMLAAAIRRLGYTGHDHNEADALWLLELARTHVAGDATKAQPDAMAKLVWPELASA